MPPKQNKEEEILQALGGLTEAVGSRFDKVDDNLGEIRKDATALRGDMNDQFRGVYRDLEQMKDQLDRIESSILNEHAKRLEALERKVGLAR